MNIIHTLSTAVLVACCSMSYAGPVVDLAPGDFTDSLSGIMNTQMSELIGSPVSNIMQDFTIFDTQGAMLYQGALQTLVVRSNETGNLHFNYRLMNPNPQLTGMISHIEITGFSGFQTRVEFRSELSGLGDEGPSIASRSADGDMLTFGFGDTLATIEESRWFFAMTDTDSFIDPFGKGRGFGGATATVYLLGGESTTLSVSGPIVPAPGAMALLSAAGLITVRRRR